MIREFDQRGGWDTAGDACRSCAHWLNWRTGLAMGAAREKVRVARALGELRRHVVAGGILVFPLLVGNRARTGRFGSSDPTAGRFPRRRRCRICRETP